MDNVDKKIVDASSFIKKLSIFDILENLECDILNQNNRIDTITVNNKRYYRAKNCALLMGYRNTNDAIHDHVSKNNTFNYGDLVKLYVDNDKYSGIMIKMNNNLRKSNYINDEGFYELILNSKMASSKNVKEWVKSKLYPLIKHNIALNTDFKPLYSEDKIIDYDKKNVVYVAYVGQYNGEHYFKFGITKDVYRREYREHHKTFGKFNMQIIYETDNNAEIETLFKKELNVRKLSRSIEINKKNQTEIFAINAEYTFDKIKMILKELVDNKILPSLKNANDRIKELELELEIKMKSELEIRKLDLESKMKFDFETKKLELETKKLELETKKLELETKKMEFEIKMKTGLTL